jgi:Penicillin amidase
VAMTAACCLAMAGPATAARLDFGRQTWNVLPPGQSGAVPPDRHSTDQLPLYDALTPLFDQVTARDISRTYKSARFFAPTGGPVVHPKRGLTIRTDRKWGVPHITGRTRSDIYFGIGWATARDRGLFMETIRYPSRFAVIDAPGYSALSIASSLRGFTPSRQTERFIRREKELVVRRGARGRRVVSDVEAFVAGINAFNRKAKNGVKPWTYTDVTAVTGLLGQVFGSGGGNEVRSSMFLGELRNRFGAAAYGIWRDLRSADDPETPTTTGKRFPYVTERGGSTPGSLVVDPGSLSASAARAAEVLEASRRRASNAVLIARKRSATGHPLAVMGPQLGYFYPELFMEVDAHGGGVDVRGGVLPGIPYVLIGRGPDYAWSATSANNDNVDQFLEELCNQDGTPATRSSTHYMYMGICRPMKTFFAGTLAATSTEPEKAVTFKETVHGPVSGTVTVSGKPYAVSNMRSTRGRESIGGFIGSALNTSIRSQRDFRRPRGASASPSTSSTWITGTSRSSRPGGCRSAHRGRTRACRRSAPANTTGAASWRPRTIPRT